MPVSGKEEQSGVLSSWPLLDVSAGIPLKKRRLLMVPPPPQSCPSKETDNDNKMDEAQSSPDKETETETEARKKIDGSVSDLKKEESFSDLKTLEQSKIIESVLIVSKIGGDKENQSESIGKEPGLDLKTKNAINSDQELKELAVPEAKPVGSLEVEKKSLAAPIVPLNNVAADHDGKIQYKQVEVMDHMLKQPFMQDMMMVGNNEGSSSGHGKSDASVLSLSLSKGTCSVEAKDIDVGTGKAKDDLSPIRMNWDLNTPMDSWDGSSIDEAIPASKKTDPNSIPQFLDSTDSRGISFNKGKQLIGTEDDTSKHSSCLSVSIQGDHELEDSLRLTLGVASPGMKTDKPLSTEAASRKFVLGSSVPNAAISTTIGFGIVKPEPSGDHSKKTSVQPINPLRGFVDSCSVKRESSVRPGIESSSSAGLSEKPSGQASIKAEPVMEDLQHGLLKIGSFQYGGSSSGLSAPSTPRKSLPSSLARSSTLSACIGISNQSECTFQINDTQASNCNKVQAAAKVNESGQKFLETEASGREMAAVKSDIKISKKSEISPLKISKNHNNMRVGGEGSVSDEDKLNMSVQTTEYEGYGSDYESGGRNKGYAIRSSTTQNICLREDDDFEDGELREAQAQLHVGDADAETLGIESVKPVNSDANSSVCIDGESGNNLNDNPDDRTVKHLTPQEPNLPKKLFDGTKDKLPVDTSRISHFDQSVKGIISDFKGNSVVCDEPISACYRTVETIGEASDDNVYSVGRGGSKFDSSPSKVDETLKRDGACIESTNGGNKSRIITLPRTSMTSLFETKSFPNSSRNGREREEFGSDNRPGFIRERFHEPHFRNQRNNYTRGRGGRFAGRMGSPRVEWDSEREFSGRSSNDTRHYNRSKCSAYNDMEMEQSNYSNARDVSPLDTNRGRKPVKELPYHPYSRRLSPSGGRDDPPTRDMQMLHKVPRNASPGRRNNDVHGSDFVGVRNEKFSRPLRNDNTSSSYNRSNSGYEDGDEQYVRGRGGGRNFSTGQRRFFPRVRSKSPIGSRTHSPGGQWSPLRRRSPDRFKAFPKVVQRRQAPLYGADRMSSPDRSCFPEDVVPRRRGSPSYMARATNNDPRDVDSGSEHGHSRPFNSRRSPSDRVYSRGSGRPDVTGSRIRGCDDDFFSRPQSGGFREGNNGEGNSNDDRRKCNERITFRPNYNADNDNRRFHVNDGGPRSFRFRSDGDNNEYAGRNMGGDNREFDGRIKNRPAVAPRRMNY